MSYVKSSEDIEHQQDVQLKRQKRMLSFLFPKNVPPIPTLDERKPYPESKSNYVSQMMFWWLNPVLKVGYQRTLTDNDLFYLNEEQTVDHLYNEFKNYFEYEVLKAARKFLIRKKIDPSTLTLNKISDINDNDYHKTVLKDFVIPTYVIPLCLFKTMKIDYLFGIISKILSDVANSTNPLLQKKLINFVEYKSFGLESNVGKGVGYAIGVCLLIFFSSITINHAFHKFMICGASARGILTRLLLDKSLSIDAKGNHDFTASKVQSMISTDMNRIDMAIGFFPFLLTTIIPIGICIGLLIWNIGVAALVGIGIFLLILVIFGVCVKRLLLLRKNISKYTDIRVDLMKELLKNYKMIKFYSWENSYSERIKEARSTEMKQVLNLQSLRNVLVSLAFAMPLLASMATFCTAFDITTTKSAADIFSSLTLFQVLAVQFMLVPMSLTMTTDLVFSSKKLSEFISTGDIKEEEFKFHEFKDDTLALKIESGDFEWETFDDEEEDQDDEKDGKEKRSSRKSLDSKKIIGDENIDSNSRSTTTDSIEKVTSLSKSIDTANAVSKTEFMGLHNINLQIKKGEFIVVTGSIGSGKSSLLNAMSGLMKRTHGDVFVDGELLLCGYPWVQNATIRENILFGKPFDSEKYDAVVEACSLLSDFDQFPGGDMTEVGERGITLSGGQKARINLARAVYADTNIILLDDVLSAVDAKVGRHIVDECILGLLKDKTRIMATHQLSLINFADRMIFLNGDSTVDIGTIDELKSRNTKFKNLLSYQSESKDKDDESELDLPMEVDQEAIKEQEIKLQLNQVLTNKSKLTTEDKVPKADHEIVRIVGDEEKAVNALELKVYLNYGKLAFGRFKLFSPILFLTFAIITTFCNYFSNTWLTFWIEGKFEGRPTAFYMGLYIMFSFLYTFCLGIMFYLLCYYTNTASKLLNLNATQKILHVPMAFMDVSPLGRVLNRFTKDTDVLDNELVEQLRQFINPFCNVIGTIILCIIYIPWFAIAVPLIVLFYVVIANYYQASAREIKRLEATKRSLVYSHFNEVLSGKDLIKAYRVQDTVKEKLDRLIDSQNEAYFLTLVNQRWLGANLSILAFAIVFIVAMLCVFTVFHISAASTGLLLTYVINLTGILTMMMRALTQVENEFNSVERINHYAFDLAQEAPYEIPENDPAPSWPESGEITFENVSMKYRPELPYVLKDISLSINKTEKVGFCGRTGAGKSTFMTCLYRFSEFEGEIKIDNVDISKLGLHTLRSKLTIIPQDPVLFIGSIRDNLDPFHEHDDDKLWHALSTAGLINKEDLENVKKQLNDDENLHKFHLNKIVEDDGANFSIGERQLIALARALVRKTKILILDEATSSVDYETDYKIQQTIAKEFKDCTILCIAHRLNTILNYDKIVVMNEGKIVEFDEPKKLYMNESGLFRNMCQQAKITLQDFE